MGRYRIDGIEESYHVSGLIFLVGLGGFRPV